MGDLLRVNRGRVALEALSDLPALELHLRPVLDRLTHVREDTAETLGDLLQVGLVDLAVDLDMHPRLDPGAELVIGDRIDVQDLLQRAGRVAANHELGMDDQMEGTLLAREVGGDRVDEEGHVVSDDLDDRLTTRPALLLAGRGEDAHVGCADRAVSGNHLVGQGRSQDVLGAAGQEVLGGDVPVVAAQERLETLAPGPVGQFRSGSG